jgi:putative lipoic acid-binding regulatory protein
MEIKTTAIDQEPPRIEFPCPYPIKVMGVAGSSFRAEVVAVIERHSAPVPEERITVRHSNKGNYESVTVIIDATGEAQLQKIFADLKNTTSVKLVL